MIVDPDARRLVLAGVLRLHLARRLPSEVPAGADDDALTALAAAAAGEVDGLARLHRVHFEPAYPGTGEVEPVRHGHRLVLTCGALDPADGAPLATVVTVLVPGRDPRVAVLPPGAGGSPRAAGEHP